MIRLDSKCPDKALAATMSPELTLLLGGFGRHSSSGLSKITTSAAATGKRCPLPLPNHPAELRDKTCAVPSRASTLILSNYPRTCPYEAVLRAADSAAESQLSDVAPPIAGAHMVSTCACEPAPALRPGSLLNSGQSPPDRVLPSF